MKIDSITCYPVRIPGHPYMGGHGTEKNAGTIGSYVKHTHYRSIYTMNAECLMVRITTDTGLSGWGETQSALVPHIVGKLVDELVAPGLIGEDPLDRVILRDRLYDQTRDRGHDAGFMVDAISVCDIALWDLVGQAMDQPVYQLLGGAYQESLPCYVSGVPAKSVEEQIDKITQWLEKGFTAFKISLGFGVKQDAEHIQTLRETFGTHIEIYVDAHWAYSVSEAIELARHFERLGVGFMECPINPEDIDSQARLPGAVDIPIALGEEYRTRYHFKERLLRGALDLAQPDIGRLGITEGMRVVTLCDAFGIPVAPHIGSGLAMYTAAALHVAAATPNLKIIEYQPTQVAVSDEYFSPSLQPQEGRYTVPQTPGLGVQPEVEKLEPYLIRS